MDDRVVPSMYPALSLDEIDEYLDSAVEATKWCLGFGKLDIQPARFDFTTRQRVLGYTSSNENSANPNPISTEGTPWLVIAERERASGVEEFSGGGANPRIIEYLKATGNRASNGDETPWCSAFVKWVMDTSGFDTRGTNARARSWLGWGREIEETYGAIVILKRGTNAGSGHVGFYLGRDKSGKLRILGGNQSDSVRISSYSDKDLLGFRWPQ